MDISNIVNTWNGKVLSFMEEYPEFKNIYRPGDINTVPPIVPIVYFEVNSFFRSVFHYVCSSGVRYSYAVEQWIILLKLLESDSWDIIASNILNIENDGSLINVMNSDQENQFAESIKKLFGKKKIMQLKIQPKKINIYKSLINFMVSRNLTHKTLSVEHINEIRANVSGIGDGCYAWCKFHFTTDDDCIDYSDIIYIKSYDRIYNCKSTHTQRKKKANEWISKNYGRVARQLIYNYRYV